MEKNLYYQQQDAKSPRHSSARNYWSRFNSGTSRFVKKKIFFGLGLALIAVGVMIAMCVSVMPSSRDNALSSSLISTELNAAQTGQLQPDTTLTPSKLSSTVNPYGYHPPLFAKLQPDLITTGICFLIVCFASLCGTGGGGILVPLYIALEGFSAQQAIPLSKATIFGGAVANVLFNLNQRHPTADRPRIDLNIAMSFEPICLAGTTLGVLCNHTFPTWLIVLLLLSVLGATTLKTVFKGIKKYKEENAPRPAGEREPKTKEEIYQDLCDMDDQTAKEMYDREKHLPLLPILLLVFCFITVVFFAALRGGAGAPSIAGVVCNSPIYWVCFIAILPIMIAITVGVGYKLIRNYNKKRLANFPFQKGDVVWDKAHALYLPFGNYIAGVCAGMLGIGGGMIKGPIMMAIEVETRTAAATTAFMILFTSACTCTQFILFGQLKPIYGAWFAATGFFASILGQIISKKIISKYNKTYFIIFILAAVVGASAIFLTAESISLMIYEVKTGTGLGFFPICPVLKG